MANISIQRNATLLGYSPEGVDKDGNVRHRVRWTVDSGDTERSHKTIGAMTEAFHGIGTGVRVDLIFNGRGTITGLSRAHVGYPHEPGYLYDCPACESKCHCTRGNGECVFEGRHNR